MNIIKVDNNYLLSSQIRELWEGIYGKPLHNKWWDWLINEETYAYVIHNNLKPLGMICIKPQKVWIRKKLFGWNFLHNGGILKSETGKGLYSELYRYLLSVEDKVNYGFPNQNVMPIYFSYGAKILTVLLTMKKINKINKCINRSSDNYDVKIIRPYGWLYNRFVKNPRDKYNLYVSNNNYIITKIYNDITQIIYIDSDINHLPILLSSIENTSDNIEVFINKQSTQLITALISLGYYFTDKFIPVYIQSEKDYIINIQAGDSDVF